MSEEATSPEAKPAVRVSHVTKTYRLYKSPRDRLKEAFLPGGRIYHRPFDALNDISLEIPVASTIGIIGRNGSGKSTLLQCICGIIPPTSGEVEVHGRIAALLELGAGFNPEFSGRDNLYINAAILGLSRQQVDQRLHKILAFADIGDYIDQPVRSYSSGMYVRLAFAIAIHVDPEILIVDEALAVGDVHFQAKCYERLHQFREQGVTVIFVTHDLNMVTRYCDHAYLLSQGKLVHDGNPRAVVSAYRKLETGHGIESGSQSSVDEEAAHVFDVNPYETRYGNSKARIIGAGIYDQQGSPAQVLHCGDPCRISLKVKFDQAITDPVFAFTIKDVRGTDIAGTNTHFSNIHTGEFQVGETVTVEFTQQMILNPGNYLLSFGCVSLSGEEVEIYDRRHDYLSFQIISDRVAMGVVDLGSTVEVKRE